MAWQFTIRNASEETVEECFAHGARCEAPSLPFILDDKECPALPAGLRLRFEDAGGEAVVVPEGAAVVVDGMELGEGVSQLLHHGSRIVAGGVAVQCYRVYGRPGVSLGANAVGWLGRLGVAAVLAVELFAFIGMPLWIRRGERWQRQVELQEILWQTDGVRRRLDALKVHDALLGAWRDAMSREFDGRARYLRRHGGAMSSAERKAMLENLKAVSGTLERMEARGDEPLERETRIQLEAPVRGILEE